MEDIFDDENTELDVLDEAVTDIANTRLKYFNKCKILFEKTSDLEDTNLINQISRQTECNNQTVEVISVPEVKLPNLNHFSGQNMEQYEHLSTRVRELNKILELMDRRNAKENSVRWSVGNQSSLLNPDEADAVSRK